MTGGQLKLGVRQGAWFSECRRYRYALWRLTEPPGHPTRTPLVFCALNPSTADADDNDKTVTKMEGFAKRLGYAGGIIVINVFAFVSTDPAGLRSVDDPIGPLNHVALSLLAHRRDVVASWGGVHAVHRPRVLDVARELRVWATRLCCLGRTAAGQPRHPSRLAYDTELEVFR
jgi:hypothetical protein